MSRFTLSLLVVLSFAPAVAAAAPPPNDDRANAQSLDPLPATVQGTTVGATAEPGEGVGDCSDGGPSVWYAATAAADGTIGVRMSAGGDLDYDVDIYRRVRSQLRPVTCDHSDGQGNLSLSFAAQEGDRFLVHVVEHPGTTSGTFTLHMTAPLGPARPPGARLPASGVTRTLDRAENTDDAWSVSLHSGVTYRVRLSGRFDSCRPTAEVYLPGTTSYADSSPAHVIGCGQSLTFTPRPGEGGLYSIRVRASSAARRPQGYHLEVARAGADDTAPGSPIHNHRPRSGVLRGNRVDAVDLYRFVVTERSRTALLLETEATFSLVLLDDRGHRLGRGTQFERTLRPGTYFVAVRAIGSAEGSYLLHRDSRTITHIGLQALTTVGAARLAATITPAESGPVRIVVERFDPLVGWLFADQFDLRAAGGSAAAAFSGKQGRYRAVADFLGTRDAAASTSRSVRFRLRAT